MFYIFVAAFYFLIYPIIYLILFFLFPYFFGQKPSQVTKKSINSIIVISLLTILFFAISLSMLGFDEELSNRILHSMAGGFTAFIVCFLAMRDSQVKITRFQFLFFGALLVTALGVVNEIVEFFGQNYTTLIFAQNINDTWLDLISNTVGIIIGAICFAPFLKTED